uniref:Uncharacterized protein n=1 Tax=Oryza glumipatula TaxID=40148 RepID=A0A0E0BNK3_9ORYZ
MGQCCTGGGKAVAGDEAEPGTSKAAPPSRGTSSKNGSAKQQPCSPAAKAAAAASSSKKPAGPIGEVLERPMEEHSREAFPQTAGAHARDKKQSTDARIELWGKGLARV